MDWVFLSKTYNRNSVFIARYQEVEAKMKLLSSSWVMWALSYSGIDGFFLNFINRLVNGLFRSALPLFWKQALSGVFILALFHHKVTQQEGPQRQVTNRSMVEVSQIFRPKLHQTLPVFFISCSVWTIQQNFSISKQINMDPVQDEVRESRETVPLKSKIYYSNFCIKVI